MRFYVPKLKDKLRLTQPWSFTVYDEARNQSLVKRLGYGYESIKRQRWQEDIPHAARWQAHPLPEPYTLPAGAILTIDRIFVRQGANEFASITFRVEFTNDKGKVQKDRFWVKLDDANRIEFEPVESLAPST